MNSKLITDATNLKRQLLTDIANQKGIVFERYKDITEKQRAGFLNAKNNKFSGYMEVITEALYNLGYLQGCIDYDIEKVKFYAVIDDRTTKMCKSLNGQVFYVKQRNIFERYSDIDKARVEYDILGMQMGINLPPIDNHFHFCRSWITATQ